MARYDPDAYLMASTIMVGLVLIPLLVLGIMSCCTVVRHRGDPARAGTPYLISAFPFALVGALFGVVIPGIVNLILTTDTYNYYRDFASLYEASLRLSSVGSLFQRVADIMVMLAIVEFSGGFLYALSGTKSAVRSGLRIAAWVVGFILLVLSIAWTGLYNSAVTGRLSGTISTREYARQIRSVQQLGGAYDVLQFIISTGLIAYASTALHKYRAIAAARNAPVLLVVASVFNFVRWLYYLIFDALFLLPEPTMQIYYPGEYIYVVEAIFNNWFFLIILALLFALAMQKAGGLWSTAQPWTAAVPMGYAPYGQQQMQPQPAYQYGPGVPHQNGFSNVSPPPQMMQQQPYVPPQGPYQPAPYQAPTQPQV